MCGLRGYGGVFTPAELGIDLPAEAAPTNSPIRSNRAETERGTESRLTVPLTVVAPHPNDVAAHDIAAATQVRFLEALKRNHRALGGVSNIQHKRYGMGGVLAPANTIAAVPAVGSDGQRKPSINQNSDLHRLRRKSAEAETTGIGQSSKVEGGPSGSTVRNGFAVLQQLFGSIKAAEEEALTAAAAQGDTRLRKRPRHNPLFHHEDRREGESETESPSTRSKRHHMSTGNLLMRALLVAPKRPSRATDAEDSDASNSSQNSTTSSSSDTSSIDYSVDSQGDPKIDEMGNLKIHRDLEREEQKRIARAERGKMKERALALRTALGPRFNFSQFLHLQIGIAADSGQVKCYLPKPNADMDADAAENFYSVDEVLAMHADNPHQAAVVRALEALARHYSEHCKSVRAAVQLELDIETGYLNLEERAQNQQISKSEFSDLLSALEEQERMHEESKKKAQLKHAALLESLALAYGDAVRMAIEFDAPMTASVVVDASIQGTNAAMGNDVLRGVRSPVAAFVSRKNEAQAAARSSPSRAHLPAHEGDFVTTFGQLEGGLFSKTPSLASLPVPDSSGLRAWEHKPRTVDEFKAEYAKRRGISRASNSKSESASDTAKISIFSQGLEDSEMPNDKEESLSLPKQRLVAKRRLAQSPSARKHQTTAQRTREVSKDDTIRHAFSKSATQLRASSPLPRGPSPEQQKLARQGWSHFHHTTDSARSHNHARVAQEQASASARLRAITPQKLRHRLKPGVNTTEQEDEQEQEAEEQQLLTGEESSPLPRGPSPEQQKLARQGWSHFHHTTDSARSHNHARVAQEQASASARLRAITPQKLRHRLKPGVNTTEQEDELEQEAEEQQLLTGEESSPLPRFKNHKGDAKSDRRAAQHLQDARNESRVSHTYYIYIYIIPPFSSSDLTLTPALTLMTCFMMSFRYKHLSGS